MHAFFLESSADILQFAIEDVNKLDCRISPYFTADTQIIWPRKNQSQQFRLLVYVHRKTQS